MSALTRYFVAAFTPLLNSVSAKSSSAHHKGWGAQIEWCGMNEGLKRAAEERKPMMVIVHSMNCPACVRSKQWFSQNKAILDMSSKFVMVNLEGSDLAGNRMDLAPDGYYIPRMLFVTPTGRVMREVRTRHPEYGYTYTEPGPLLTNMKAVIRDFVSK